MRTSLGAWSTSDAASLAAAVRASPDLAVQLGADAPGTVDEARAFIAQHLAPLDASRFAFAVRVDGVAVGSVALSNVDRRHDTAWVSYWVATSHRGRGLASRALASAAQLGLDDLGLARLELGHRVNNPASCRVATAAGFVAEGVERAKLRYGSERFDVETHARLATDPAPSIDLVPVDRTSLLGRPLRDEAGWVTGRTIASDGGSSSR